MNFLISYPRSGNTFLSYCFEYLTGRPTLGCYSDINGFPIYERGNNSIQIKDFSPILIKEHHWEHSEFKFDNQTKIIFMIRDFNSSILSHIQRRYKKTNFQAMLFEAYHYMSLIKRYEEFSGPKSIIYFEDFVKEPKKELERLFEFLELHVQESDLDKFMNNYTYHVNQSKKTYHAGMIQKKPLSETQREDFINYMRNLSPYLFNKFLQRYGYEG